MNFGLFDSGKGFRVYLTRSKQYDENDDDWAIAETQETSSDASEEKKDESEEAKEA